ncbi:MAG: hypothetical protein V1494_01730 [Candidatus Diapherotrites archaeon]
MAFSFLNWLKKLFSFSGSAKAPKASRAISSDDLLELIDKRIGSGKEQFERDVFSRFAEVKHLLNEVRAQLGEMGAKNVEEGADVHKRFRKIVSTSQRKFVQTFQSVLLKLEPPSKTDFELLRDYCVNSRPFLQKELAQFSKSIAISGLVLKDEMRGLGRLFKELDKTFASLQTIVVESEIGKTEAVRTDALRLGTQISSLNESRKSLSSIEREMKSLSLQKQKLSEELGELASSGKASSLDRLLSEKGEIISEKERLRQKIFDLLSRIDKPLRRFQQLAESKAFPLDGPEAHSLKLFLSDPFLALRQDPRADSFKKVLLSLGKAIEDGAVSLKPDEIEKRLAALNELQSFDFFGSFFWKLNELDKSLNEVEAALSENQVLSEKESLESKVSSAEKKLASLSGDTDKMKSIVLEKEKQLDSLREKVEASVSSVLGEKISLSQ